MKNTLLFLLLIPQFLIAQYEPFPTENALWEEEFIGFAGVPLPYLHFLCGDTVIDNQVHSKVYRYNVDWEGQIQDTVYVAALYEGNDKKVWITHPGGTNELLYDFTLNIGDSFSVVPELIVESISNVTVNGEPRRALFFQSFPGHPTEIWVEGIGSNYGLLTRGIHDVADFAPYMKCFSKNDDSLFNFDPDNYSCNFSLEDENCAVVNAVSDLESSEISWKIFPNPFQNSFLVQIENYAYSQTIILECYNLYGQKMIERHFQFENNIMIKDLALPSGSYIITLTDDRGNLLNSELVICTNNN